MEFLFAAAAGSAITHELLQRMNKVELENMEKKLQQVDNCYRQGKYTEAISILEQLRKKYPLNPDIYFNLWCSYGKIASTEKNKENAVKAVDTALECHEAILWLVGQGAFVQQDILELLKKHKATLKMIKDVATGKLRIVSDRAKEYSDKADSALEVGNYKVALQFVTEAIKLETDDVAIAGYHAKRALIEAYMGDCDGATSDCKIALKCEAIPDGARKLTQNHLRALQKIDKTWKRDLLNESNKARERLGDISDVCSLCGGKENLLVEGEMTICKRCRKEWWDRKAEMVKNYHYD